MLPLDISDQKLDSIVNSYNKALGGVWVLPCEKLVFPRRLLIILQTKNRWKKMRGIWWRWRLRSIKIISGSIRMITTVYLNTIHCKESKTCHGANHFLLLINHHLPFYMPWAGLDTFTICWATLWWNSGSKNQFSSLLLRKASLLPGS